MYAIPIERAAARSEPVSSIRWSRRQGPSPKKRRLSLSHRKTRMSDFMKRSPSFGYISGMVRRDHEENPEVSYEQDHEPVLWKIQPGSQCIGKSDGPGFIVILVIVLIVFFVGCIFGMIVSYCKRRSSHLLSVQMKYI